MPRYEQGIDPATGLSGLEAARAQKRNEILDGANAFVTLVKGPYSELESMSWAEQRAQASAVLAGETLTDDSLLVTLAQTNNATVPDFAARVLANVQREEVVTKSIVSQQQAFELAAKTAATREDLDKIKVEYRLPQEGVPA